MVRLVYGSSLERAYWERVHAAAAELYEVRMNNLAVDIANKVAEALAKSGV